MGSQCDRLGEAFSTVLGRVTRLQLTAIKSFGVLDVPKARITATGLDGNRRFLMVDDAEQYFAVTRSGVFLPYWAAFDEASMTLTLGQGQRTYRVGPVITGSMVSVRLWGDRVLHGNYVEGPWGDWISSVAEQRLRLVMLDPESSGYDVHPLTLVGEASIRGLGNEDDGRSLDARRFRMSVYVDVGPRPFVEDEWAGRTAALGDSRIVFGGMVPRCAAIQHDPENVGRRLNVLRRINELRGIRTTQLGRGLPLGVYASVAAPGEVRVGDPLRLCDVLSN